MLDGQSASIGSIDLRYEQASSSGSTSVFVRFGPRRDATGEDRLIGSRARGRGVDVWAGWAGEGADAASDELFHPYELGRLVDSHEALTDQIFILLIGYFEDDGPPDGFAGVDGFTYPTRPA